jgi:hypothetical protein
MDKKEINKIIIKIESYESKLNFCDNNQQYVTRLEALHRWLLKLDKSLSEEECLNGEFASVYQNYFCLGTISIFDRVHFSLLEYRSGNKPFSK